MPEFCCEKHPVAAKNHVCEWCGEVIATGEKHLYFSGKWDREFFAGRMHTECEGQWNELEGDEYLTRQMERGGPDPR